MIAKLVVSGDDRNSALARAARALAELRVEGVATVVPFHRAVVAHPAFAGERLRVYTQWIETELMSELDLQPRATPAVAPTLRRIPIEIDGRRVELGVPVELLAGVQASGTAVTSLGEAAETDTDAVLAPVSGTLVRQLVTEGDTVAVGDAIAVCEAMKMETQVLAERAGTVTWLVREGDTVALDTPIAKLRS